MSGVTRRLLLAVTVMMPRSRRGWGEALIAELSYVNSRRDKAQLLLGAVRMAVLPSPGLDRCARSVRRAALVAVTAWVPLAAALYLTNVVFPSADDTAFGDLALRVYLVITLMAAGAAARRTVQGRIRRSSRASPRASSWPRSASEPSRSSATWAAATVTPP